MSEWTPDIDVREAVPTSRSQFQMQTLDVALLLRMGEPEITRHAEQEAMYRLRAFAARRMLQRVEVQWPADWREAFKERWFPAWALKRWPVRYHKRRMEAAEWLHHRFLDRASSHVAVEVYKPSPVYLPTPDRGGAHGLES
jgi:hypothetical protein